LLWHAPRCIEQDFWQVNPVEELGIRACVVVDDLEWVTTV